MDKLFLAGILIDEKVEKSLSDLIKREPSAYVTGDNTDCSKLNTRLCGIDFEFKGFRVLNLDDGEFLDIDLDSYLESDLDVYGINISKERISSSRKINAFADDGVVLHLLPSGLSTILSILPLICNDRLLDVSDSVGLDCKYMRYGIGNDLQMTELNIKIDPINKKYDVSYNGETVGGNLCDEDSSLKVMMYNRREGESLIDDILENFGLSKIDGVRVVNNIVYLTKNSGSFVIPNGVTKIVMTWNTMYKNLNVVVPKTVVDFRITDYEPSFNNVTFYVHKESDKAFVIKLIESYFDEDTFDIDDFNDFSLKELAELCSNSNLNIDFY